MLKLYGVYRSRAARNFWLIDEIGADHLKVPVIQAYRLKDPLAPGAPLNTRCASFLALSPAGAIPVMDDDGFVLTESLAINLYLGRRYGGLLGPQNAREDALMVAGALHAATAIEADALAAFYVYAQNRQATPEGAAELEKLSDKLRRPLATVEARIAAEGHPVGRRFTLADINLAENLRYAQAHAPLLAEFPATKAWLEACQARPAFRAMMESRAAEPA